MVLSIILIIICTLFLIIDIITEHYGLAALMAFCVLLNIFSLKNEIHKRDPNYVETHIVKDVKGYDIDTIKTINGADTTQTYVLTYWK